MNLRTLYYGLVFFFLSFFTFTNVMAEEQPALDSKKEGKNKVEVENVVQENVTTEISEDTTLQSNEGLAGEESDLETEESVEAIAVEKIEKEKEETVTQSEAVVVEKIEEKEKSTGATEDSVTQSETVAASEPETTNNDEEDSNFYAKFIKDRVQVGIRSAHRTLTDDDSGHRGGFYGSGTFLGTIYALDAEQNYFPLQLYGRYFINDFFGIELGYDQYKAKSVTPSIFGTDGDLELSGITISLMGFYRNSSKFTPYLGLGLGLFSSDFSESENWKSSYNGHRQRRMVVDDVNATIVSLGVMWEFAEHWNLDLSTKYIGNADVDAVFKGYTGGTLDTVQPGHFPMDSWAFQIGISYNF